MRQGHLPPPGLLAAVEKPGQWCRVRPAQQGSRDCAKSGLMSEKSEQRVARPAEPLSLKFSSLQLGSQQEAQRLLGLPGPGAGPASALVGLCVLGPRHAPERATGCVVPGAKGQSQNVGGPVTSGSRSDGSWFLSYVFPQRSQDPLVASNRDMRQTGLDKNKNQK